MPSVPSVAFLRISRKINRFDKIIVEKHVVIQNWILQFLSLRLFPPFTFNLEPPRTPNAFIKIIFSGNIKIVVLIILNF